MEPMTRVAINGFGRIGRQVARLLTSSDDGPGLVAVNSDRADARTLAHLLKYDSVHGRFEAAVSSDGGRLTVRGREILALSIPTPRALPWSELGIDLVVESTGRFRGAEAREHLEAGAGRVLITAPAPASDATLVIGVNEGSFDPVRHLVVSGASCTTNCLGPIARLLHDRFEIVSGFATAVHAYTRDQELLDGSHDDLRRGRAAALNLVPTDSGLDDALARILPDLHGRLGSISIRVPSPDVSLLTLSVRLGCAVGADDVNDLFREAALTGLPGVVGVSDEPLVSSDFVGDGRSAVVDLASTREADPGHVQVLAWYDNEYAYAARIVDLAKLMAAREMAAPRLDG
jgi:glyceraldehyde 3-phosphate dehydrogenase